MSEADHTLPSGARAEELDSAALDATLEAILRAGQEKGVDVLFANSLGGTLAMLTHRLLARSAPGVASSWPSVAIQAIARGIERQPEFRGSTIRGQVVEVEALRRPPPGRRTPITPHLLRAALAARHAANRLMRAARARGPGELAWYGGALLGAIAGHVAAGLAIGQGDIAAETWLDRYFRMLDEGFRRGSRGRAAVELAWVDRDGTDGSGRTTIGRKARFHAARDAGHALGAEVVRRSLAEAGADPLVHFCSTGVSADLLARVLAVICADAFEAAGREIMRLFARELDLGLGARPGERPEGMVPLVGFAVSGRTPPLEIPVPRSQLVPGDPGPWSRMMEAGGWRRILETAPRDSLRILDRSAPYQVTGHQAAFLTAASATHLAGTLAGIWHQFADHAAAEAAERWVDLLDVHLARAFHGRRRRPRVALGLLFQRRTRAPGVLDL